MSETPEQTRIIDEGLAQLHRAPPEVRAAVKGLLARAKRLEQQVDQVAREKGFSSNNGTVTPAPVSKPVCDRCKDTHVMSLQEEQRDVPCTACPPPCFKCCGGGAYCRTTPCPCTCHRQSMR